MRRINPVSFLVPFVALGFSGAAYVLLNCNKLEQTSELIPSIARPASKNLESSSLEPETITDLVLSASEVNHSKVIQLTSPGQQKLKKLSGNFRGDWGETPIYAKNDRVNYERGAYLSLADDNQNQPPTLSKGYWRLLHQFKAVQEQNCFSPAPGIDMGECDLTEAGSLKDRDLRGANFAKARLNGDLGAADLSGANLSGAAIIGSLIISADTRLDHANFSHLQSDGNNPVIAESAKLSGVDFRNASLYGAKLQDADLSGARLSEAILTGSQLTSARFDNANLHKSDMAYANLSTSTLTNAVMTEANLEQADMSRADLSNANLQKANFAGSKLAGTNFSGADLRGVNFSGAQGGNNAIVDSQTDFTAAICPDGKAVDGTQVTTCIGHGF